MQIETMIIAFPIYAVGSLAEFYELPLNGMTFLGETEFKNNGLGTILDILGLSIEDIQIFTVAEYITDLNNGNDIWSEYYLAYVNIIL